LTLASRPAAGLPSVVHLVRRNTPLAVFERFLESYRRNEAGVEHRFVLLCKGFSSAAELAPVLERLDGLRAERIDVPDDGYDLTAYRVAAAALTPSRCCFLNSYSTILAANWLAHLHAALELPGVGLVGASGSWGSHRSFARFALGLGGPYARVYADRRATTATFDSIGAGGDEPPPSPSSPPPRRNRFASHRELAFAVYQQFHGFSPFPAPHVRSTGFMLDAASAVALLGLPLATKFDTYRAESGAASVSARVERSGSRLLVVDRDGNSHGAEDWPDSRTFWQGEQEQLMIADKQTDSYSMGNDEQRLALSRFAWGSRADSARAGAH
jgi:hypothetical protein